MMCSGVFLPNFKVLKNLVKYCLISILSIKTKTKEMKKIVKIHAN